MVKKKILDLREEITEIAAVKNHKWTDDDFTDEDTYGIGDATHYGHVKLISNINDSTTDTDSHGASIGGIKSYVISKIPSIVSEIDNVDNNPNSLLKASVIKELIQKLINNAKNELTSDDIKNKNNTNETLTQTIQNLNSTMSSYESKNYIDLTTPKSADDIDELKTAGYYHYNGDETITLTYNGNTIHYKNALITVEKQPNGNVLQYIYATQPDINFETYSMDGTKFLRFFNGTEWEPSLSLIYTPQKNINVITQDGLNGEYKGDITITETTSGFIINWKQNNTKDNAYKIETDQYQYQTIGTMDSIAIGNNPYIFGNLIGKIDIKITNNTIAVRSTLPEGSLVKNVNTTLFVPRMK